MVKKSSQVLVILNVSNAEVEHSAESKESKMHVAYTHIHTYTHIHRHIRTYTHVHTHIQTYTQYIHTYTDMHTQ